jgi:hypothetical protein
MQSATSFNPVSAGVLNPMIDSNHSGVSWSAVIAGSAASAVLSLLLFILGVGLGLSSMSPWRNEGIETSTFGWLSISWVAFTQIVASGFGGYLAGRLRVKWSQLHGDEVYFRDTAHGFLAWAIASLVTAAVLGSATAAIATGGAKAGVAVASASAAIAAPATASIAKAADEGGNKESSVIDYYVDNLFHTMQVPSESNAEATAQPALDASDRAEVVRIFSYSLAKGELSAEDKSYLGQMLAHRNGMIAANAEARVTAVYNQTRDSLEQVKTKARQLADQARKIAAKTAIWMFIALLCGAFVASLAATWGGIQRDSARNVLS